MPNIPEMELREIATRIFKANGSSDEEAIEVADDLVESNLAGVDDHGVAMIPYYVQMIKSPISLLGFPFPAIRTNCRVSVIRDSGPVVVMDGDSGFGQVVARRAMRMAIGKAKTFGVGIVAARELGPYRQTGRISDASGRGGHDRSDLRKEPIGLVSARGLGPDSRQ